MATSSSSAQSEIRQICTSNQRQLNNCENNWSNRERERAGESIRQSMRKKSTPTHTDTNTRARTILSSCGLASTEGRCEWESETTVQHQRQLSSVAVLLLLLLLFLLHFLLGNSIEKCAGDGVGKCHLRRTHTHAWTAWQLQRSDCVCVRIWVHFMLFFLLYAAKFIKSKRSSCRNSKTPPTTTTPPTLVPAESLWEWWTPLLAGSADGGGVVWSMWCGEYCDCGGWALCGLTWGHPVNFWTQYCTCQKYKRILLHNDAKTSFQFQFD